MGKPSLLLVFTLASMATSGCINYNVNGTVPPYFAVADRNNSRVLIWNSAIPQGAQPADVVLGQSSFSTSTPNFGGVSGATLSGAVSGVIVLKTKIVVADTSNNRLLIWNSIPTTNGQTADLVLGQTSVSGQGINSGMGAATVNSQSMDAPSNIFTDGVRIIAPDYANSRFLVWNSVPSTFNQPADLVIGQPDFNTKTPGPSQLSVSRAQGGASDGVHFVATDYAANRVLIWNIFPSANGIPADNVLGEPDFFSSGGGSGANLMNGPSGACINSGRLAVADSVNNRVLVWNSWPTNLDQAANIVLGQPDMSQVAPNNGGLSLRTLNGPGGIFCSGQQLIVADASNCRLMVWNSFPTSSFQPADYVMGQTDGMTANCAVSKSGYVHPSNFSPNYTYFGVQTPGGD